MPQQPAFTADDFRLHASEKPSTSRWQASSSVPTPFGSFIVELNAPPDAGVIQLVNETATLLVREQETILNSAYGLYQQAAEDKYWMKQHRVPRDLDRDQIEEYLRDLFIFVRRDNRGVASATISMRATWDSEHLISFGIRSGRLVPQ